jgi:hypothetical protein
MGSIQSTESQESSKKYSDATLFPIMSSRSKCMKCGSQLNLAASSEVKGLCATCYKSSSGSASVSKCGSCKSASKCNKCTSQPSVSVSKCTSQPSVSVSKCTSQPSASVSKCGSCKSVSKCGSCKSKKQTQTTEVIRDDDWTPRCDRKPQVGKGINKKNLVIVNGPNGVGKTTLIKYLVNFDEENSTITYNTNNPPSTKYWIIIDTNSKFCEVISRAQSWLTSQPEGSRVFIERNDDPKTIKRQFKSATTYGNNNSKLINLNKQFSKSEIVE